MRRRRSVDRMPPEPPATLAAWLRTRSDEQLSALLVARPDVARPAPSDVVALASRLAVPVSVDRALDELDAATLQVLDVVLLAPTDGVSRRRPGRGPARSARPTSWPPRSRRLTTRALLWGDEVLRAPDPVRRAVRHPAGLGRRATELRLQLPARPGRRARRARPGGARRAGAAGRGAAGRPPARRTGRRRPHARPAGSCSRGCSPASTRSTSSCRGRSACTCAATAPSARRGCAPSRRSTRTSSTSVDRRAAGAALESVGRVGELLAVLEEEPAGLLRSGGRRRPRPEAAGPGAAHRRAATPPGCSSSPTPPACSTSAARTATSGCPPAATTSGASRTCPTAGPRWPAGWLAGVRLPSLVGQRDVAGKAVNPLSPDLVRHTAPAIRRSALTVLAEFPPGSGPGRRRPGGAAALAHPAPGRPAGAGAGDARRGRPAGRRSSAACCPRPAGACWPPARTAPPTACAACCPNRSTTCSPSPTCR